MSAPRVAVVVKYYPPLPRISGIVTFVSLFARHLAEKADVHVVTMRPSRRETSSLTIDGCTVHRVDAPFPITAGRAVRRLHPDATLVVSGVHDLRAAVPYFALFDAAAGRAPKIFFQATTGDTAPSAALSRVLADYRAVLCASDSITERFLPRFPNVATLHPGVNVAGLSEVRGEQRSSAFRVVFASHINRIKGADIALDIIVPFLREFPDADAVVAGFGPLDESLRAEFGREPRLQ
ncbi:MAG TPA: hypothetical protein VFR41_06305, partial [Acidimicrobiia bacterium]|nr:hypothetical protein [Acidimicrobiia bacterium]